MKYRESHTDKKLRSWFNADMTCGLLRRITLRSGVLRGLNSLDIEFQYPITAIAGKNGSGKSTILALACCAYHGKSDGFKLSKRKNTYYTFSDFFVQHASEHPPQGLLILYSIAYDKWKPSSKLPDGVGVGIQLRKKKKEGKWNDYAGRVRRTVVFLGIERIVPHSERSQSRSYSKVFKDSTQKGWEQKVMTAVGTVIGKTYTAFRYVEHSKYSLPIVRCGGILYSGFNMGAGENALFEIFSTIYAAGSGALLVLDEVELGLHAEAQRKFMEQLKGACLEMRTQVICTTHSREIFECLPSDARFFVESINGKTRITQGVSSEWAFAKLSAIVGTEIDILVEDEVARAIVLASLPASTRSRASIVVLGSAALLARQLAAMHAREEKKAVLAIFDGDQRANEVVNRDHCKKMAEKPKGDFEQWWSARVCYLPGDTWPESWLLQMASGSMGELCRRVGLGEDDLAAAIEYGKQAGKHDEFYELSKHVALDEQQCLNHFACAVTESCKADVASLNEAVVKAIERSG